MKTISDLVLSLTYPKKKIKENVLTLKIFNHSGRRIIFGNQTRILINEGGCNDNDGCEEV